MPFFLFLSRYIFLTKIFLKITKKRGDTCDEKSQISPLKRHGKGSLLLPCSKIPIGIFFIKIHYRRIPEFRALREFDDDDATIPESRLWREHPRPASGE